jgi:thiol-disulfide isomerase/thioredoxin
VAKLSDIETNTSSCADAINEMKVAYRAGFIRQKDAYELNEKAVEKLKELKDEYTIVVLFAHWCGDSRRAVPALALLEERLGKPFLALGGMTKPPYGSEKLWKVPPSPKEVETFNVTSSPTILIFNKDGEEIGRIKTRAKMTSSIEEEILKIIEDSRT